MAREGGDREEEEGSRALWEWPGGMCLKEWGDGSKRDQLRDHDIIVKKEEWRGKGDASRSSGKRAR